MNSLNSLLFEHWLKRKMDLLSRSHPSGVWRGNAHPTPIVLHRLIDDELDRLRPIRDVNERLNFLSVGEMKQQTQTTE